MALRFLVVDGNDVAGRARQLEKLGQTAGAGYAHVLEALSPGAACSIVTPADEGADLPDRARLSDFDAVVLTGSGLHIWEGQPTVLRQIAFARTVFESGVPFFGSCWGLQIATAAAGGRVEMNPNGREVGIARNITLTEAGRAHPLMRNRPLAFDAPCVHLDSVIEPAPGTVVLASNAISPVQAAEISHADGVFWGVQYHPEFSLAHLSRIIRNNIAIHINERRFADETDGARYCDDLALLSERPDMSQISWRYGIGPQVTDASRRQLEIANFIAHRVQPYAEIKRAA